jgi:hypothetical protein
LLERQVPVFVAYITVGVTDRGSVHFFPDIYNRERLVSQEDGEVLPDEDMSGPAHVPETDCSGY